MSGKFVALLLVLSCVAQGYDARASPYAEARLTIDEILTALNELIYKIREELEGLGELIQDMEQKIKDIIKAINIPGILAEIKKNIEDIIKAAGIDVDAAASCISEETEAVEELVSSTTDGVTNCMKEFNGVKDDLSLKIAVINGEAEGLIHDIFEDMAKCFKDSLPPLKLLECLKGVVESTQVKASALVDKINAEIKEGQQIVGDAANKLATCIGTISEDAKKQENDIVDKFQTCIDAIVN